MEIKSVDDLTAFSSDKATKNLFVTGEHCRVTLWCLESGQSIEPHIHAGDHFWSIQEGEGYYLDGEKEHKVNAGQMIFAPEGEPHGMRAVTKMTFISVSAG
ncbi:MAG: hypothetical protein C0608_05460 [Deltaproteobacteria bacterium]|nr:MAG: hypothetical protein C0608_05460 [Deltaproteobacteria bacterium]